MRTGVPAPPRWQTIFLLSAIAVAVAFATKSGGPSKGPITHQDPGRSPNTSLEPVSHEEGAVDSPTQAKAKIPGPIPSDGEWMDDRAAGDPDPLEGTDGGGARAMTGAGAAREISRLTEELRRTVSVISLQVIDPAGRPVPGVQVDLGDRQAVTDSEGEAVLPQKRLDLILRHPEFFPRTIDPELRRGLAITDREAFCERLIVVLFPGGRIHGQVKDSSARPLTGVQVAFDGEDPSAVTGARGEFRSPILRPGIHHLFFFHPCFQRADGTVTVPPSGGEVRFDVDLHPGLPSEIRVVDAAGAPVSDAEVRLILKAGSADEWRFAGRSGDSGILAILRDPETTQQARVLSPGYREETTVLTGDRTEIRLQKAPLLVGQVIDRERGLPVKATEIILEVKTEEGFRRAPDRGILFRTLAAGRFRVGLPPFAGTYQIKVLAEGDLQGTSEHVDFDGSNDPPALTIHLERRTGLRGLVSAPSPAGSLEPVHGARVEIYRHEGAEALRIAQGSWLTTTPKPIRAASTDAAGAFVFTELKPAVYRVRILHPDFADWVSAPVTVPMDAPMPCTLGPGAVLHGSLIGASSETEAETAVILVPQGNPFVRSTLSDAAGRYEFRDLPEGSYLLFTGDPSGSGTSPPSTGMPWLDLPRPSGKGYLVAVRRGAEVLFDIRREARNVGSVSGKILSDGAPLGDMPLRIIPSEGPAGDSLADAGAETPRPEAGGAPEAPQEAPPAEVAVGVPDAQEKPADQGSETTEPALVPAPAPQESGFEITTAPDGSFRLEGLPPGKYRISGDGLSEERTVEIAGGRMTELDIGIKTLSYKASLVDALRGVPIEADGRAEIIPVHKGGPVGSQTVAVEQGRIEAANLYPGRYRIRVKVPGYAPFEGQFEVSVAPTGATPPSELRLRPPDAIRVMILDPEDKPFRGSGETVLSRDGREILRSQGAIDGAVMLPALGAGTYSLMIKTAEGSTNLTIEVDQNGKVRIGAE